MNQTRFACKSRYYIQYAYILYLIQYHKLIPSYFLNIWCTWANVQMLFITKKNLWLKYWYSVKGIQSPAVGSWYILKKYTNQIKMNKSNFSNYKDIVVEIAGRRIMKFNIVSYNASFSLSIILVKNVIC